MPFLTWGPALSVGIEEIDQQHRALVALLNDVNDIASAGGKVVSLTAELQKLVDYTVKHFQSEEQFMASIQYPALAYHKEEHRKLKEHVAEYQRKLNQEGSLIPSSLVVFLWEWLTVHIQHDDALIGRFAAEHGPSSAHVR